MNAPTMTIVGASGALFGVLAGVGLLFPNTSFPYFFGLQIKWIVILYGAAELYSAFMSRSDDLVAHTAHLGGLLFGYIMVKIYQRDRTRFY
jgi:membrane associated rhomboid family serine protease